MLMDNSWYEIENNFWCPCEDKFSSQANEDHLPECRQHKILMKISNNIEYLPGEIPQTQHGKKRNSVVDEFLANLETMNTSRRRSSSKLLPGFVPFEEIVPSLSTRVPGLEVYLPACFSSTKLEKLESILDQDHFEFVQKNNFFDLTSGATRLAISPEDNHENENDDHNYESTIESKDEIASGEPPDFTAGTLDHEKGSMEIRTSHNWDVFANDHYVEIIQNSVSNTKIANPTCSNEVNMEIVQETGNFHNGYDGTHRQDVSNMMTIEHEDDMQETAEKFSDCSLGETKSSMSTTQQNYTERLGKNTINEWRSGFRKDESNKMSTTQRDLATKRLRQNTQNGSCSSCLKAESNKISTTRRNLTERIRRSTLNEKFSNLQASIPDIANKKNISKVDVIKSAVLYIKTLEQEERFYLQIIFNEKQRNKQLLMKLTQYNPTNTN
ncbi:myc proto-oncogene -like [Paramuricea clavata]|uniref:Myc proto-oncogene -like n=1 Tax=Paramuricea clavata TaxID=317549 RepID=A0A6S7HL79_PARCT|nr:myc proto-oncogene -like [Paramuricea clavata]